MAKSREIEKLMQKGHEQIQSGAFHDALKTARKIIKAGVSFGYVIEAQAHANKENFQEALNSLTRLTEVDRDSLYAWRIRADFHRDMQDYEGAITCYESALKCEDAPEDSIRISLASVLILADKVDEAREIMNQVKDSSGEFTFHLKAIECSCLLVEERFEDVKKESRELLDSLEEVRDKIDVEEAKIHFFNTHFNLARAYHATGDLRETEEHLFEAVRFSNGTPSQVLDLIREVNDEETGPEDLVFRVQIKAAFPRPVMAHGVPHPNYMRQFDVAACGMDEAMEYICELEQGAASGSLQVLRAAKIKADLPKFKGVLYQSSRQLDHSHHHH